MKTTVKLMLFAFLVPLIVSSCNKDESKLPFSEMSVEENKQVVENSAIQAAKALDAMKDHKAVDASVSFVGFMEMSSPTEFKSAKNSKALNTIEAIASLKSENANIDELLDALTSPDDLREEPETIQDLWEAIVGVYSWNSTNEEWNYTANTEIVELNFPSTENGTNNNAKLTISNYTGVIVSNPLEDEYNGDLPASLNLDLEVDGSIILSYTFAAKYNEEGIPTSLATDLTLDPFKFSVDLSNNDKKATASYKLTDGGDIIMEISGEVNGDFTQENIDNNTVTVSDTYEYTDYVWNENTSSYDEVTVTETSTYEEVNVEEIFQSGKFKLQLYNISINGNGDIKAIGDSLDIIYPKDYYTNNNFNYKAAIEMEVSLMNNNLNIFAIDEDSKTKIAEVEAYMVTENYDGYLDYWIDFRMVFGDGSLVDLETYFEEGFEQFVAEINSMIGDLNSKYDWDLEPIDY